MAIALGDPEYGYYRKADPLGRAGDFITAPEISQVFGEIIGLWCAVCWQQAGAPSSVNLVEFGPGRGTLMADALRAAASVPTFADACKIHLIETSPALRACQEATLTGRTVRWHEELGTVPRGPALIIANEFFDALPIDQYQRTKRGWRLRCVGIDPATDQFCYLTDDGKSYEEAPFSPSWDAAPEGSLFETCPAGLSLATALGERIATDGLAALIIDYGHVRSGAGETLQAVRNHKPHEVLADPGDADLTAHVDFAALAARAEAAGAHAHGPVPQGAFLTALGIEARTDRLAAGAAPDVARLLHSGYRRLIGADTMGMLFKAMALTNKSLGEPAGFESLGQ
jgi:NADH dehydrogenase [ubiquinone] 1 alpha subcomplex assembly factor 7